MQEPKTSFETWALVELFGHQRIAGKVTESEIGGGKFIRVDVPEIKDQQPITRFYGPAAIYGITPITEQTALALATNLRVQPVASWDVIKTIQEDKQLRLSDRREVADDDQDDDE